MKPIRTILPFALYLCSNGLLQAGSLATAFTYQGRLTDAGNPVAGPFDLRFTLFDANSGVIPSAGPITNSAVNVSNGLFTTTLDFGSVFDGGARWLEIGVRANGGDFTTLSPRQLLTASPYAIYAPNAGAAATADSIPWSGLTGVPTGFADGVDNDTTYTAGAGLGLTGTVFSVSFAGTGVTNAAARSDHDHASTYAPQSHAHPAGDVISGTLDDARLSANVARLSANQQFSGTNVFQKPVVIGGSIAVGAMLDVEGDVRLNNHELYLRDDVDGWHGLGYYGYGKTFGGQAPDGPVLYGWEGGGLGSKNGGERLGLLWNSAGMVVIDPAQANSGALSPGLGFGAGGGEGIASKRTSGGNQFGLDFYTASNNRLSILNNGNVGVGTTAPAQKLSVAGAVESTTGGFKFPDGSVQTTAAGASGGGGGVPNGMTEFSTAGSNSFMVPTGITRLLIEVWGGGGGGGSGGAAACGGGGGGGGGGGYSRGIISVTSGQTYSVIVGTGGPAGGSAQAGGAGGNSSFQTLAGTVLLYAGGGGGGSPGASVTYGAGGAGGAGGTGDSGAALRRNGNTGVTGGYGTGSSFGCYPGGGGPGGAPVAGSLAPFGAAGGAGGTGGSGNNTAGTQGHMLICW